MADIIETYVDLLFANEEEAATFTNMGRDYYGMAKRLAELADVAVVKLGKDGSLIAQGNSIISVNPHTVEQTLDTTGAGDLWAAGFLYGWANGKTLEQSGIYGSLLGAETVQIMGAALPEARWISIREALANIQ